MLRKFRVLILLALAALAWNVTPAYSTTVTYTDLASWQAATTVVDPTIDFTGLSAGGINSEKDYSNGGLSSGNVQFIGISTSSVSLQVMDTNAYSWANFGSGEALIQPTNRGPSDPVPSIHVMFATPVTAFGSDLFNTSPYGLSFSITVAGTTYTAPTFSQPTRAFWGITSDTPISDAVFTLQGTTAQGNSIAFLDNFTYGTANAQAPPPRPTFPKLRPCC
jgi:hypothetical protein